MDGAILLDTGLERIVHAGAHLMPDAGIPTTEHGTRVRENLASTTPQGTKYTVTRLQTGVEVLSPVREPAPEPVRVPAIELRERLGARRG